MSVTSITPRVAAEVVWHALLHAEDHIHPSGTSSSRLFVAIRAADSCVAWYASVEAKNPNPDAYETLVSRLDDLKMVESLGVLGGNLPEGSLQQVSLSLAIHVVQCALAGVKPSVAMVMADARRIVRLADRETA